MNSINSQIKIITSLIIKQKNLKFLCEYTPYNGNYQQVIKNFASEIQNRQPGNYSVSSNSNYNFHFQIQGGCIFLIMTEKNLPVKICFSFLNEISNEFFGLFPNSKVKQSLFLQSKARFARFMADKMVQILKKQQFYKQEFYGKKVQNEKLQKVQEQIDNVKNVMIENIDKQRVWLQEETNQQQLLTSQRIFKKQH